MIFNLGYDPLMGIEDLAPIELEMLLGAIARREGNAATISKTFDVPVSELRAFVEVNHARLTELRDQVDTEDSGSLAEVTPTQLDELWLSNKFQRLRRYQTVADMLFKDMTTTKPKLSGSDLSTAAREFRSYAMLAANELGQLLHRGAGDAGDGDTMSIDIGGIDINNLR